MLKNQNINVGEKIINQDTSLKLVYLQYLLMFNINSSNGIFLDSNLQKAQRVLDLNNGKLVTNLSNIKY